MPEFLDFGKNTVYILACYGLSAGVLLGLIIHTLMARRKARQILRDASALAD